MPAIQFLCPDGGHIEINTCLDEGGCRLSSRCATRSYLKLVAQQRPWTGIPSTTQLIRGTMESWLRIVKDYAISPDDRAFMIHGTKAHYNLGSADDEFSVLEEKLEADNDVGVSGIFDVLEEESGKVILVDYKTSGSFKVAKALGFHVISEPTGVLYKSGPRKGTEKMRKVLVRNDDMIDVFEWQLQLNMYRIKIQKSGRRVDELRVQCIVRDGNTWIARSRGVFRNVYYFKIPIMDDEEVLTYFNTKKQALLKAVNSGEWKKFCNGKENWDGIKCTRYCDVAEFCGLGKYLKKEKETRTMPIKGLTEERRLPRIGSIRLGVKVISKNGKEIPKEVDYFVLDPKTVNPDERKRLIDIFHEKYGEKPRSIKVLIPLPDEEAIFPHYLERWGTTLKCKGDGVTATCTADEYAEGLEETGRLDGLPIVKCLYKECIYYKERACARVARLQVLVPELPGTGVWQITTGSAVSISNILGDLVYIKLIAGRFHMVPLDLERIPMDMTHEGKRIRHYVLKLNTGLSLLKLRELANIDEKDILSLLPPVESDKEDIVFEQTPAEPNGEAEAVGEVEHEAGTFGDIVVRFATLAGLKIVDLKAYALDAYETEAKAMLALKAGIDDESERDSIISDFSFLQQKADSEDVDFF